MLIQFYFCFFLVLDTDNDDKQAGESTVVQIADDTFAIHRSKNYVYYKGYAYQSEKVRDLRSYYRCIESRSTSCKARLKVQLLPDGSKEYTQFREHNHKIQC